MKEIFPGVFRSGKDLLTVNLVPGKRVYGEKLLAKGRQEFREWVPQRSKLAAAIMNGLQNMPMKQGSRILYLGAASGTTPSHVSDIVGHDGIVYALEFSERPFRSLIELARTRKNIAPLLADARKTEDYYWVEACDILYCDIADPQQTEIAIRNFEEFIAEGFLLLSIKSQSIDVVKEPLRVYEEEKRKLEKAGFDVLELIDLEPYEEKHCFIVAKK
ncbi:MAG: fibrillarin-like rRNA/tRNA 2'-O-methyltransferase [Candidatus Aenigmarchaeota archaeon]|nr:fibrillarin-like rRNA/tRNA 2'-O-methyltransferase [Candidatus Aenigmarchaeota archaeon]